MTGPLDHPLPELPAWTAALRRVATQPLECCPQFPQIAERHEAWWRCQPCGGPLLISTVNRHPSRPITRGLDLLEDPDRWLEDRLDQMRRQYWGGDAFPTVRVDFGPVMLGGLLGGRVSFLSDTTWTHPFIDDDWSNAPDWQIHEDNPWWNLMSCLLARLAEDAAGRYVAMAPSLGGTADVLLNFRGSAALCLDVLDRPGTVLSAVDAVYPNWRRAIRRIWQTVLERGAGLVNWVGLWSDRPYAVLECDFNYMIGPREFNQLFLPDIIRQAAAMGRAIFHLDGQGATRHIQALLEAPEIQAIQYVAGAGKSAFPHLAMLREIQARGRALQISCPLEEVLPLARLLRPEGLAFLVGGFETADDLDAIYRELRQMG